VPEIYKLLENGDRNGRRARRPRSNPAPATNLKINQPRAGFFGPEIYEWPENGDQNGRRARRPRSNPAPATNLKINQPRAGFLGLKFMNGPKTAIRTAVELDAPDRIRPRNQFQDSPAASWSFRPEIYKLLENGDQNGRRASRHRSNPAPQPISRLTSRELVFRPEIYTLPGHR
jgi:hypothetical protein